MDGGRRRSRQRPSLLFRRGGRSGSDDPTGSIAAGPGYSLCEWWS
ncbi:hypothetical protein ATSB10_00200 [Dyella thiooxydans]|uniref:Uncharacterized protein n=1 Tax=Dyella thiooxydans TaxID=445710 RepID=A0A160MX03_9GAMM|nr:hypothetical protein ATSB10_00200 [Dyella thiooxydans]